MVSFRRAPADATESIRAAAWAWVHGKTYERILTWIGDAPVVILGAATCGTHDFYAARAALTRHLIEDRGFAAVAVDGDWCEAYTISRFAQGLEGREPSEVLSEFDRFPSWIWRNTAMAEFAAWLHEHNTSQTDAHVGLYGLDLYRLHDSMRTVVSHLEAIDPSLARSAATAFATYDQFGGGTDDPAAGRIEWGDMIAALTRGLLLNRERCPATERIERDVAADEDFYAAQQRRIEAWAETYYRSMLSGATDAWNTRGRHMAEMLDELRGFLVANGRSSKVVVWAQNGHAGDARATNRHAQGRLSLGQLARERYGRDVCLVGFTSYAGNVVAATDWGGAAEIKPLQPAIAGSVEGVFHQVGLPRFFLPLDAGAALHDALAQPHLARDVGVVYWPEQDRWTHYYSTTLVDQFDAIMHVDETHPLEPLESVTEWNESPAAHVPQ